METVQLALAAFKKGRLNNAKSLIKRAQNVTYLDIIYVFNYILWLKK